MKLLFIATLLFFSASLRAQSLRRCALTDTTGHIVSQFFYRGTDSLPSSVHDLTGITGFQLQNKSFLKWQNSAWVYTGPKAPMALTPLPDPGVAQKVLLKAAGCTDAQTEKMIPIP